MPRRLAENVNLGVAATSGAWVLFSNPDVVPDPDAVGILHAFAETRERCGIAGPRTVWPDGSWQPTRRSFPTVRGTLVRRTPLRRLFPPLERQRDHYHLDEDVTAPAEADWLLGAFLLMRREMLDELGGWDEGYRHYVEDIDLCYRAMRAGWERWYVPRGSRDARLGPGDRPAVPLPPHALARAGHGALRLPSPRDARAPVSDKAGQYAGKAAALVGGAVRLAGRVSRAPRGARRVARCRARDGRRGARPGVRRRRARGAPPRARPSLPRRRRRAGDGRGGRGEARRRRRRRGGGARLVRPARAGRCDHGVPRDLLRARPCRRSSRVPARSRRRSSCSTSTRASTASTRSSPSSRGPDSDAS